MLTLLRGPVAAIALFGIVQASPVLAQSAGDVSVRLDQVEEQMRQLIGQVEQLTYEVKQLKSQLAGRDTGAAEPVPQEAAKPRQLATQQAPGPTNGNSDGIEQVGEEPLSTFNDSPAADLQAQDNQITDNSGGDGTVELNKAPGPQVLGTLGSTSAAAQPGDGGFQGKVLVAPGQQEPGDDAGVMQGNATTGQSDTIQNVALSPESPEALYERSNESLLRRQFGDAEAGFRTFIQKYPDHSLAGSAQYWLGETYYAQSDFRQAAQAFLQGYRQYPDSRRAPDSLLKLGISLGRLGQQQQACAAYAAVSSEYPKAVEARKRAQSEARRAGCQS
jgi:tol-pal system protein YbgF